MSPLPQGEAKSQPLMPVEYCMSYQPKKHLGYNKPRAPSLKAMVWYNIGYGLFNAEYWKMVNATADKEMIRSELNELNLSYGQIYDALMMYILTSEQKTKCGYPMVCLATPGDSISCTDSYPYGDGVTCGFCRQIFKSPSSWCPNIWNLNRHIPLKVMVGEDEPFVKVKAVEDPLRRIVAMDCEMCLTTMGLEVTKVTVLDLFGNIVYDRFVLPGNPIVDYNTQYSGITPQLLAGVTTTLYDVQMDLLDLMDTTTIIIGHALENDLKALRLVHNRVIDTSVVFPDRRGVPFKRSLKNLVQNELNRSIQDDGVVGHDSRQDACACIMLMLHKLLSQKDLKRILSLYTYYEPLANQC